MERKSETTKRLPLDRLEKLAWLLDNSIRVPGTQYRIGLDGLIGLIPGVGDALGAALSSYILAEAAGARLPKSVLFRMAGNIALETVIGAIPIFGDLFDMAWKANARNVKLLHQYRTESHKTVRHSRLVVALVVAAILLLLVGITALGFLLAQWLWALATH